MLKRANIHEFEPIRLEQPDGKGHIVIHSIEDAARKLLTDWPEDDSEEFYNAVKVCLDGINGKADPELVRLAVVAAAEDAGLSVG